MVPLSGTILERSTVIKGFPYSVWKHQQIIVLRKHQLAYQFDRKKKKKENSRFEYWIYSLLYTAADPKSRSTPSKTVPRQLPALSTVTLTVSSSTKPSPES